MKSLDFDALKQMARAADESWGCGIVRLPGWVGEREEDVVRTWAGICGGRDAGIQLSDACQSGESRHEDAAQAFVRLVGQAKRLPGRLEVWDSGLAEHFRNKFREAGVPLEVAILENKPAWVAAVLADLAQHMGISTVPGMLSSKDVTVEIVRGFAEAAVLFHAAAPWKLLSSDSDLVRIESPDMPREMKYCAVLGRMAQEYGLAFYLSEKDFRSMAGNIDQGEFLAKRRFINATFSSITQMPMEDADLWEDAGFPMAGRQVPLTAVFGPGDAIARPDAQQVSLIEGLFRAFAATTEAEVDSGRWEKVVKTAQGDMTFVLSLPQLQKGANPRAFGSSRALMESVLMQFQEAIEKGEFSEKDGIIELTGKRPRRGGKVAQPKDAPPQPRDNKSEAQELIWEAWDAQGRKRMQLVARAIELWPECADAFNILAHETGDVEEALGHFRRALELAAAALGPDAMKEFAGHFWGVLETRPYMRAKHGMAACLWRKGAHAEAIGHLQEMLELNPGDNQGVRYGLLSWLLAQGRDRDAAALIKRYAEDSSWWTYGEALLAYRLGGDTPPSRAALKKAVKSNAFVPDYLAGRKKLPMEMPAHYGMGDEAEAIFCARDLAPAWQADASAIAWVLRETRSPRQKRRKR